MTEDEMVGWHHRLNGHEFEQIPGDVKSEELTGSGLGGHCWAKGHFVVLKASPPPQKKKKNKGGGGVGGVWKVEGNW